MKLLFNGGAISTKQSYAFSLLVGNNYVELFRIIEQSYVKAQLRKYEWLLLTSSIKVLLRQIIVATTEHNRSLTQCITIRSKFFVVASKSTICVSN